MADPPGLPAMWEGPGLVDLQVNGYAGFDFNASPDAWTLDELHRVRRALSARGVVIAVPTLVTDDAEAMTARARRYAELLAEEPALAETFPCLHLEGPFISNEDGPRGAHPKAYCRTPQQLPDFLTRMQEASGGRVGILTLAPELPDALELIARAASEGVCVAIGHTKASAEAILAAVAAGARMSTHLGNGSHQMLPRLDNYVQFQLAEDRLFASFIADGHHMPFYTLKNFLRAKGLSKSILVTDAIVAAELGPGRYQLGGEEVVVSENLRAAKPGSPYLAGSALTLDCAIINTCLHCGFGIEEIWPTASTLPAGLLGLATPAPIRVKIEQQRFTLD